MDTPNVKEYNREEKTARLNKQIVLPIDKEKYQQIIEDAAQFRAFIGEMIEKHSELFPSGIKKGFWLKDIYYSKKMNIKTRRIEVEGSTYSIRCSFMLPYMRGETEQASNALFLRKFSVPYWGLAHVFGRNAMYWYELEKSFGNKSIVGTTIQRAELLPEHINVDEKHTRRMGEKEYIATVAAQGCILNAQLSPTANEEDLTKAYGVFKKEAQVLDPDYKSSSVITDGWMATKNAFLTLFPQIVLVQCFLHIFIKIRDRSKKKYQELYLTVSDKLWLCYESENKRSFSQRVRRLWEWVDSYEDMPDVILLPIKKLKDNIENFSCTYDLEKPFRTSNMVDRLMQRMHKYIFDTKYFKGCSESATLEIRAWALLHNFLPYNPVTAKKLNARSPAEKINGKTYHDDWLQNLLISGSLNGYRSPQNPL